MRAGSDHERDRRCIIDAAYSCLFEPHTGPIRVSDILRRAGVSSRAFYRHFGSKDDLFLALLQRECDALAARVDRIAERAAGNPSDQLAAWIGELFDLCADPQLRMHVTVIDSDEVRAAAGYRAIRERSHADRERSLVEILARGRVDGSFPLADPELDAVAISAAVGRVLASEVFNDLPGLEKSRARVVGFALRAVGAVDPG
ncbi:TetR/AcrR family transcriptional regulator [Mycobacterium sp. Y57]|uniref:TetR/AcrR family transcriptional regulator n=1 Tax=Mycolicibacterium xanthum TaxID=2796469 RepID=UPI001C857C54|nr:TetR/AcrR family transcriptional regulator [Mycolicibacterium xanthum]MBX7433450.1 TetR/AcrR family transcriptional regulator [Mycolicibacterium xanthum]